jgi:hypothetical protein
MQMTEALPSKKDLRVFAFIFCLFGRNRLHTNFKAVKSTMIKKQEISPLNERF